MDALLSDIQRQLEFYFSDASLGKDRFLQDILQQNQGGAPVVTLLTFNKLRRLTTDPTLVVQAAERSSELLVQPGDLPPEHRLIARRQPFVERGAKYSTERTIYVEVVPPDSTHDSLKEVCAVLSAGGASTPFIF
eukprot:RCo051295